MNKTARLKRLSRHLLATTCLTLAGVGAAHATTINETSVSGGDFGNTLAAATNLSTIAALAVPGTNTANGVLVNGADADFFIFHGIGETPFTYNISDTTNGQGHTAVFNSSGVSIGSTGSSFLFSTSTAAIGNGIVPTDGEIIVGITSGCECGFSYTGTVAATVAPEPGTLVDLGLGFGLAGAIALGRRRRAIKA